MGGVSFAGYSCTERLSVDHFGELWLARGPGGRRVQLRRVDPQLAQLRAFSTAFLRYGERLAGIEHPNLIATLAVGHDDDDALVVVQDDHEGQITLESILKDARLSGVRAPPAVALWIVRQVVKALARVHRAGVVHGGVHPRSVLVDKRGEVRLADVAVARALAAAAGEDDSLLRGLLGYVAPELALGDEPGPRSDVFAVGALLHELYTGAPPPGIIEGPASLVDACERALHTDAEARFPDATELAMALDAAAGQLAHEPDPREVARYVAESHGGANRSLEAETENMLAGLDNIVADVSASDVSELSAADLLGASFVGNRSGSMGLDHTPLPPPMPLGRDETRPSDSWLPLKPNPDSGGIAMPDLDRSMLGAPGAGPTAVGKRRDSAPVRIATADVISERIVTPTPLPAPKVATPTPQPRAAFPSVRTLSPTDETMMAPPAAARGSGPTTRAVDATPMAALPQLAELSTIRSSGGSRTLWLVAVASVIVAGVVLWKSGVLNPRDRSDAERAERDQLAAAERSAEVGRTRYADVVIDSDVPDAAVWMSLGKTPVDSLPLAVAGIYELRVQQEGFKVGDVVVTPTRWTGTGDARRATLRVTLEPAPGGYLAPAAPPKAPAAQEVPAGKDGKSGRGRIHVDSDPPGAQVWLLVGFTPSVRVQNLAADKNHEFKIMLDGRVPAFAVVAATDFMDPSGRQTVRPEVKKSVVLKPRPKERAGKDRK